MASAGPTWAQAPDGQVPNVARESVIVLHGGQVFKGKITRADDVYRVELPNGEIRVRANKVAFQCDSLEEAYGRRRAAIRFGDADEHIELARWCQRNELFGAAARELADAMAAEPNNPLVPHLERQLKMAMTPAEPRSKAAKPPKADGPTGEELEEMIRQMPPGSVEMFTNSIQPLLLNSCAGGGCHGAQGSGEFRLLRNHPSRPASRRMTQRNLHAALEWIDRRKPDDSRLLVESIRAHGTAEKPAFTDKDAAKYRQIVEWVYRVAEPGRANHSTPETIDFNGLAQARAMTAGPTTRPGNVGGLVPNASGATLTRPLTTPNGVPSGQSTVVEPPDGQPNGSSVKRGVPIKRFVPVDPFDPEIFNRRYHAAD
ncbi:MAG: hypothetical protein JW888_01040 [Pirellulales bacterium]|nr:hypothetical protein [Pirellulales bacterium]